MGILDNITSTVNRGTESAGRELLYDGIAACDAERADAQRKIDELDAMSQAASAAASFSCSVCGATMGGAPPSQG